MKIKAGYNDKELQIRIGGNPNGTIELWLEHENGVTGNGQTETLSYLTLDELNELRKEIDNAFRDAIGL